MQSRLSRRRASAAALLALSLAACQTYSAPGAPADLRLFNDLRVDDDLEAAFELQPAAPFPATIAVARVQAPGYDPWRPAPPETRGTYSVVTTRDIEVEDALAGIANQPQVAGVATFTKMVAPSEPQSERELRAAAAKLRADLLLVYTLDSSVRRDHVLMPVAVLTLGALAFDRVHVVSTASALLLDTRTGFVYGAAEATARDDGWQHLLFSSSFEAQMLAVEGDAFAKLAGEFGELWSGVLASQGIDAAAGEGAAEAAEGPADATTTHP